MRSKVSRFVALSMTVLWIGLIAIPAVFGLPNAPCDCAECSGNFCPVKKHAAVKEQQKASGSSHCSSHSSAQTEAFKKGPCNHETSSSVIFTYNAILVDTDREFHVISDSLENFSLSNFSSPYSNLQTPPPKIFS